MPLDAPEDLPKEGPGQVTLVWEDGGGRPAGRTYTGVLARESSQTEGAAPTTTRRPPAVRIVTLSAG
jgi:hypothetical protein